LQAAINARAALEEELRRATKQEQLLLYYQPQVDRGVVIGAEALVRWMHPQRGLLFPDTFIPLAEETGLILPLGDWVLETACRQLATWANRMETAHLSIAVNISARQLRQPEFVEKVLEVLKSTGADSSHLELELTESMLVENFDEVVSKMTELRAKGVKFSLDDFGTGYSSLSYLRRLPLDRLKIDRAFVRDILADTCGGAIAQAIISLSRAMGLAVMAEGVESEEQREYLASLGCHTYQGYLFSKPVQVEAFEKLLDRQASMDHAVALGR
jgi:EAL domain-containing protein (putative c-di-GMP-specific phosphodiesterase class I)